MDLTTGIIACLVAAIVARVAWPWLRGIPRTSRTPLFVYLVAYLVTYCVGAVAVVATRGEILEVYWGRAEHLPADVLYSPVYWALLLMPLAVVPFTVRLLHGKVGRAAEPAQGEARSIGVGWPILLYAACIAYIAQNPTYRSAWLAPFDYFESDASSLYSRRGDLLTGMNTGDAAILYTIAPLLTFVVIQEALRSGSQAHVALAVTMTLSTVALQLALAQAGPTMVFVVAVLMPIGARRLGRVILPGSALSAWLVVRYLTVKFASRSVVVPLLEIFMRMASVYPFYIWFVQIHGHGGVQLISLLTAGRGETRTLWATLIGRFIFPNTPVDTWTPAPAHVQAYADGGLLYAFFVLVFIGVGIRAAGAILERGRNSTLDRAFLASACCTIYMTTQVDLLEALYSSWGIFWSIPVYALLKILSARRAPAPMTRIPQVQK